MASASATIIYGNNLQNRLTGAGAIINVHNDQHTPDEWWQVGSSGFAGMGLAFELTRSDSLSIFGIYDVTDPTRFIPLLTGVPGVFGRNVLWNEGNTFCVLFTLGEGRYCNTFGSSTFGFFLARTDGVFASEAHRNADGLDHMVAFQGGPGRGTLNGRHWLASEFLLAWENVLGGGDRDFDDFHVLVAPIIAVLEPGSLALLGIGLVVMFAMRRRRIRARV